MSLKSEIETGPWRTGWGMYEQPARVQRAEVGV
jgi:hypothetical protein